MRWVVALALALVPHVAAAQPSELQREFQAGVDAFRLGKLDVARVHLEAAKRLDPKLPGPSRFLAAVAKSQARWADCIAEARHAIELNPQSQEITDTRKLHDECRVGDGRAAYAGELGEGAAIAVVTNVAGATVKVGGLVVGGTPLAPRPTPAGPLTIELAKAGFKSTRVTVTALPGIVTDVIAELAPDGETTAPAITPANPAQGYLLVPPGEVTVDGVRVESGKLALAPSIYTIEIRQPAKDPWRRRVRIMPGQSARLAPTFVDTETRERHARTGLVLVGGAGAVAGFGFAAMLLSRDAAAEAREIHRVETQRPPTGNSTTVEPLHTRADEAAATDRARRWSIISTVAFGAAVATLTTGAIYLYLGDRPRRDAPPPFAVVPIEGGALVGKAVTW